MEGRYSRFGEESRAGNKKMEADETERNKECESVKPREWLSEKS